MRTILAFAILMLASSLPNAQEDAARACNAALQNDARFAVIARKLPLFTDATFEMLANDTRPNASERAAIAEYVPAHRECMRLLGLALSREPPNITATLYEAENKNIAIFADLYNKKLSYGEANRRLQAVIDEFRVKFSAMTQQILNERAAQQAAIEQADKNRQAARERDEAAQRAAQAQYEDAQRQASAQQKEVLRQQLLLQMFQNSQNNQFKPTPHVPYQMQTRPTTNTTCQWVGSQWTCTTR